MIHSELMNRLGFANVTLALLFGFLASLASFYFVVSKKNTVVNVVLSPTPSTSPTVSITPTVTSVPTKVPTSVPTKSPTKTPTTAPVQTNSATLKIYQSAYTQCGQYTCIGSDGKEYPFKSASDTKITLTNTKTNKTVEKSGTAEWKFDGLEEGNYKFVGTYPPNYLQHTDGCNNCKNPQRLTTSGVCGYTFDLEKGKDVSIFCAVYSTSELQADTSDKTPPTSSVYYPQAGGTITYKTDGKVCVYMNPPSDNSQGQIQTRVAFDENWQSWKNASDYAYACVDSLSNGNHNFKYQSKDLAGNEESIRSMDFTVNIP